MTDCAVILAGGQARRMGGGDKGRLMLGDQSLIQRVIDRIAPQVDAVVLNANGDLSRFDDLGLPVVADSVDDFPGPLAGVLAGMDWAAEQGHDWLISVAAEAVSADHEGGYTFQFGGGGELSGFQFANASFQTVNTALEDGEFLFELFHQALQLVGHFGDAVEAGVQQSSRFKAGHGPVTAVGAVGVTGNTAVALDQVAKCLISPVGWVNV